MFKKRNENKCNNIDTLIGLSASFKGNIEAEGILRVDGKLDGDLYVKGEVYIGNSAHITGNIYANNVYLSGTVLGNIVTEGSLSVLSTAKLFGDIQVRSFVSEEGGLFVGKCNMIETIGDDTLKVALSSLRSPT